MTRARQWSVLNLEPGHIEAFLDMLAGDEQLQGQLRRYVGLPGLCAPGNGAYWGSGAHSPNEHIRLADLPRAVRYNCYMFEELGK